MLNLINNLIDEYQSVNNYWAGSVFESVTHLSTDYKGRFGEELFYKLLLEYTDIDAQWDGDTNTNNDDGVYDIHWTIDGVKNRVEIKSSGRTVSNGRPVGWQHENVYFNDNSWDYLVFLDYDRDNSVVITIIRYDEVVIDGELNLSMFGKKGHIRKNTGGKAKVDFSSRSHRLGEATGFCYRHNVLSDDITGLVEFINSRLS